MLNWLYEEVQETCKYCSLGKRQNYNYNSCALISGSDHGSSKYDTTQVSHTVWTFGISSHGQIINNVIYMLFEVMWEKKQMISKAQCSPGPQNTMETQAMASKLGSYQYTPPSSSPEHT